MQFLETVWDPQGRLFLWGHSTKRSDFSDNSVLEDGRGRLPAALDLERLHEVRDALDARAWEEVELKLLLPTRDGRPLLHHQVPTVPTDAEADEESGAGAFEPGEIELREWTVPAISLPPFEALCALTNVPTQLPTSFTPRDSTRYWLEVTKFAIELLTAGRYLPGLARDERPARSRWKPVLSIESCREKLGMLARCIPGVCRAQAPASSTHVKSLSAVDPFDIVESFVEHSCDALIRTFLRTSSLAPEVDPRRSGGRTGVHLSWLRSLTGNPEELAGSDYDLTLLGRALGGWAKPLALPVKRHQLRTFFRLSPPPESDLGDEPPWRLDFGIQSLTHPEDLLPAAEIWRGGMGFLATADHTIDEVEELLLTDLGRASSWFEPLLMALDEPSPAQITIDIREAYRFLRETVKPLEAAGFGILLPDWKRGPRARVGLSLTLAPAADESRGGRQSQLGLQQLLDYSWNIALGEQTLSIDDFRRLVASQPPLVRVQGKWVELHPEQLKNTLRFLEEQQKSPSMTLLEAYRAGLRAGDNTDLLPVIELSASGWLEKFLAGDSQELPLVDQPANFQGTLRRYQQEGMSWLTFLSDRGIGGCLADDMGLGKTIQFLALLLLERERAVRDGQPHPGPTLLVVPMSILHNWQREAERFSPEIRTHVHHGPERLSGERFLAMARSLDLVVTTYNLVYRDEKMLGDISWGRIALDEAQNIKNLATKQTQSVRRLAVRQMNRDFHLAPCQRVVLTGTPLENNLDELWSIFDFLNPGLLGSLSDFRTRFVVPIERYRNSDAAEALSKLIRPFILRRLKSDPKIIDDLPEKIEIQEHTGLTTEQAALYQTVLDGMFPQVNAAQGIHRKGLVLAMITKLKQICDHPALFLKDQDIAASRSGKLTRLQELLETMLKEGDKVLIFTQYAQMGKLLQQFLIEQMGADVLFLHGALTKSARDKVILQFQQPTGPPIFVLSLKAGGFGLNLTEANQVIHYDQWWNPAVEEQATDRAYRIGQKRNVQVRKLICRGTLEERINDILAQKRTLANQIVTSTKNFITQLSVNELEELLSLGEERIDVGS